MKTLAPKICAPEALPIARLTTVILSVGTLLLLASIASPADQKYFPGQAGNDNLELRAEAIIDPALIKQEIGSELAPGMVVMRIKASNKTGEKMQVSSADFTVVSRKDGDRADALAPDQLAGGAVLVLKQNRAPREWAQQTNTPGWTGIAGTKTDKPKDEQLLAALKAKEMPDQELKPNESVSGLLYFSMQSAKTKSKDLSLLYKGPGGHLSVDFK